MPEHEDRAKNVTFLQERACEAAQQEVDRGNSIDQKAAGLTAAALVLLAAGVAFVASIDGLHAGSGAKTLWAVLVILVLVLLLLSLGFATGSLWPRAYRIVIKLTEMERWPTPRYLDRSAMMIQGEMLRANLGAIREARPVNKKKADRLVWAFGFFSAAIVGIVILASAVVIRLAEPTHQHDSRRTAATIDRARG